VNKNKYGIWLKIKKTSFSIAGGRDMWIHRTPRQLDLAVPYQFPDMTQRRVAERGVQYLRWVSRPYPLKKPKRLGRWPSGQ